MADYHNDLAWRDPRLLNRFRAGIYWLDEGGFLEAHLRRDGHHTALDDPRHRADIFSEASAVRVEPSRKAHFLVRRALREQFPVAIEAAAAGNVMKTDHAVAELPPLYAAAYRNHGARNFMPEDLRGWHKAVLDFLDIGTADAAGGNPNQDLAIGNCWDGDLFHHDAPGATVHSRAHLLQCRSCRKWRFELGGYGAHVHEISSATSE